MSDGYYPGIPARQRREPGLLPPYVEAALFLLCGMIIGGGATVLLLDRSVQRMVTEPERLQENLLQRMDSRLDLSESQRVHAAEIVERHFKTLESIRSTVQPEVGLALDALRDEISGILDDSQRELWESRFEEVRDKWRPGSLLPPAAERDAADPQHSKAQTP